MQTLPERLRWSRKTSGLTTRELAKLAGVSGGYPSAIECNQSTNPSTGKLKALSEALGVTFEWLYLGIGKPPTETMLKRRGVALKKKAA